MTDLPALELRVRCAIDDVTLSTLHARAFGETPRLRAWSAQLERHSLSWVGAFEGTTMSGFANHAWDGSGHAFLLDVVVHPSRQRRGIGRALVADAVRQATDAGCSWLHADFAEDLTPFYRDTCGLTPTSAGLLRLHR
ncbi:GNAT family N-acetyltransferase [Pseudonocardia sp. KRD291]|uniref:GNAT family N-acetyltransferase n=1 Tax=Pseudonocardia sp. KRD291 TaxID=2792007 RepID=UPI001C4A1738|nr:GNAT family N-acetyltransferase [Pseudonocardia sp. KRD291]MBW0102816.1 GNAT family N-acetyltransferase [Pseudonocardia sp. KRD291]